MEPVREPEQEPDYGIIPDMPGRLLRIRTGKHPHEILVVGATIMLGIVGTIWPDRISAAIDQEFSWPWSVAYWVSMAAAGSITMWGIFNRKIDGLLIERAGLTIQASLFGLYVYAVAQYVGFAGFASMVLPIAFAAGSLARCWQIGTDLSLLKEYLKDHPGEQVR
jgi:hypothetical protein